MRSVPERTNLSFVHSPSEATEIPFRVVSFVARTTVPKRFRQDVDNTSEDSSH